MLKQRQAEILKIIVSEYIKTNQPIGSKTIQELITISVSSATIRNESAALEETGFLEKEHTSSGRVPSTKGYRYYVDNLMTFDTEDKTLREKLKAIIYSRKSNIDEVLEEAAKIISEITKMSAVVVTNQNNQKLLAVKKMDLIPLSKTLALVTFVLSDGNIQTETFNLSNVSIDDLKIAIKIFSDCLIDTPLNEIENNMENLKEILAQSINNYEYILQTFIGTILEKQSSKKEIVGIKNMLENPEFNDTNKLKKVISLMEGMSSFDWFDANYSASQKQNIITTKIGEEISEELSDLTILETTFQTKQGSTTLSLVGPKRIDYSQANHLIKLFTEFINSEGEENG
ncbi:heat-inducible transcriptional repressor HrcA [Mesoplasma corruscae]|uniref:Heat-inducible transcription repressor HrcA n=1 Tax=Mesoplasma corruscae TaxID=216874 RepID=A0A2S5RFX7_9MOLU|nr:heat-inducible transcriptional repressor HrcA [Mesoplasma corruscae]PPE06234.1 heat-inducible transcription repressor HrcA [Mesoplasma corruscae]